MDLVDIDQVLDNLELREAADEHIKASAAVAAAVAVQRHSQPTAPSSNGVVPGPSPSKVTGGTSATSANKGFVGVSQVFNSLDDYRKNVESLEAATLQKYDEECRPITTNDNSSRNRADGEVEAGIDSTDNWNSQHTSLSLSHSTTVVKTNDHDYDEYEDEEEASNDIHKFSENSVTRIADEEEADDVTTTATSDSLTTSSSSTFSSGPSPGLVSTDEHSTPLDCEERSALLAGDQDELVTESLAAVSDNDTSMRMEPSIANGGAALEDLAYGLSSISITTANSKSNFPFEVTVSSALGNMLDDLTETTTSSLISQLRDADDAESFQRQPPADSRSFISASLSYPTEDEVDVKLPRPDEEKGAVCIEGNAVDTRNPPADSKVSSVQPMVDVVKQQQPVTFGSTMDEISDAELDSMLQEMDIDDNDSKPHTSAPENSPDLRELPIGEASLKMASEMIEDLEVPTNVADHVNADSFSQASTVEFSEIRTAAQVMPPQRETEGQSSNSIASSYTSSESSLEGDAVGTTGAEQGTEDEHNRMRPQRPTTLDLPALKTSSLYANAGQTPPGTNVDHNNAGQESAGDTTEPQEQILNDGNADADTEAALNDVAEATGYTDPHANLGKIPPIWVPDNMATCCMQCHAKFTMIKRRHHCRACGKVLCSVCCSQKFKLEFLANPESRVCVQCYLILTQRDQEDSLRPGAGLSGDEIGVCNNDEEVGEGASSEITPMRSPNPNNPMEYCSTIPPHRQVTESTTPLAPPTVIVPVGVLKKDGSYSSNSSNGNKQGRKRKSVMFSDGIAPGSDLASMEHQWGEAKHARRGHQPGSDKSRNAASAGNKPSTPSATKSAPSSSDATTMGLVAQLFRGSIPPMAAASTAHGINSNQSKNNGDSKAETNTNKDSGQKSVERSKRLPPSGCDEQGCYIPKGDNCLPPIYLSKDDSSSSEYYYKDVANNYELVERLQRETLKFAVQNNFFVHVKIVNLKCCMNRTVINFTTAGMHHVGNDEIVILLEYEPPPSKELLTEPPLPKDIFIHLLEIYREAELGNPIAELSYTSPRQSNFLGSREYGGFIFIRATFQCLQDVIVPENPFLIAILIHRYEVPWAKVFPLRLMLRLGAQYRYYPCPHISMRNRESVYAEIAQTIINFLADFRNYSYTLPSIRGMYIHMEDRQTTVLIPRNRQEDVIKAINNSSDHILAFGGNFSKIADGHLVCMQNVHDESTEMYAYSTQAINIQGQPRKVTGASFFVLNEALKSTSGLSGKCSIVEDGLMVQILPSKMEEVRNSLRNQKDIDIVCGPIDAEEQQTEIVSIKWVENDRDFNLGVKSPIDEKSMEGVSSMRVHASFNYSNSNYSIRLTDIYILKFDDWYNHASHSAHAVTSLDITRIAEQIARSASMALVPFLDLLAASGSLKIGLRATLHQDNVCYEAGTRGAKLPPLYMNALDNYLIPTLHNESSGIEDGIVLELLFYILNV